MAQSRRDNNSSLGQPDELAGIVRTYHAATERLRQTHERLTEEVHRLREELATANAALLRSRRLAALGEMAAGIAHEIRNPLASIQLYARMLEEDLCDRPDQRLVVRKIVDGVQGLDGVVGDVLAFARELRPRIMIAPLSRTVARALAMMQPMIDAANVSVGSRIDPHLQVPHDIAMIEQTMINLLRNSIEAMARGGSIHLEAARTPAGVTLTIRDTGPGIAAADLDRIFNPFFTTRPTGTGLGLAIVHRIVDAHGGSIVAHNDGGAVFTLTFRAPAMAERAA